jgi:Arc/MetJ family transcription regulator
MRTNIELDPRLLRQAMKITKARTKKEVVNLALKELVESHERARIMEFVGSNCIDPDYDYKAARS